MVREIVKVQFNKELPSENNGYPYYFSPFADHKLELLNAIFEFYLIEEILLNFPKETFLMERKRISTLFIDLILMRKELSDKLARVLFDYLCVSSFGEARYSGGRSAGYKFSIGSSSQSREQMYAKASSYSPAKFLPKLLLVFNTGYWSSSFGGKKWGNIVRAAMLYEKVSPQIFVDHIIDLAHNGGTAFDKGYLVYTEHRTRFLELLDAKFQNNGLEHFILCNSTLLSITPQLKEIILNLGTKVLSLQSIEIIAKMKSIELAFPLPIAWRTKDIEIHPPDGELFFNNVKPKNNKTKKVEDIDYSLKIRALKKNLLDTYLQLTEITASPSTCEEANKKLEEYKNYRKIIMKEKREAKKKKSSEVLKTILGEDEEIKPSVEIGKDPYIWSAEKHPIKEETQENGRLP